MADNNTANVSSGKGVKGGYFFSAPATAATLALIKSDALNDFTRKVPEVISSAVNLGYISEDGWKVSTERDVEVQKDVNGDTVDTSTTSFKESIAATLLEKKAEAMKEMYGQDNVTEADGVLTALHTSDEADERIYVADLVLKNGRRWRYIIPMGKVTEIGEESIAANSLVGREITIQGNSFNYKADKTVTSIEYIQSIGEASASPVSEG